MVGDPLCFGGSEPSSLTNLLTNRSGGYVELYDLIDDPLEQHNLAEKHPETVARLNRLLTEWKETLPEAPTSPVFSELRRKTGEP